MKLRFNRYVIKTCFPRFSSLVNPPPPPPLIIALMRLSRYTLERKGNGTMIDYYSLRAIYALNMRRWVSMIVRSIDEICFSVRERWRDKGRGGRKKKRDREREYFIVDAWVEINFLETESLIDISLEMEKEGEGGGHVRRKNAVENRNGCFSFFSLSHPLR